MTASLLRAMADIVIVYPPDDRGMVWIDRQFAVHDLAGCVISKSPTRNSMFDNSTLRAAL